MVSRQAKKRGGGSADELLNSQSELPAQLENPMEFSQSGGRHSKKHRSKNHRSKNHKTKSNRSKGRSRKGGFMSGLGGALHEALVPLGLTYYAVNKSKKKHSKSGKKYGRRN